MKKEIILINIKNNNQDQNKLVQEVLFNNGFRWSQSSIRIKNYIHKNYIIIYDQNIYTINDIDYLLNNKNLIVKKYNDTNSFIRYLKIKKIKNER